MYTKLVNAFSKTFLDPIQKTPLTFFKEDGGMSNKGGGGGKEGERGEGVRGYHKLKLRIRIPHRSQDSKATNNYRPLSWTTERVGIRLTESYNCIPCCLWVGS